MKQTEELLSNGYVTSGGGRAKAYADGTAYASGSSTRKTYTFSYDSSSSSSVKKKSTTKKAKKKSTSDYSSDFEEVFDWFEIRIEEINEQLDLMAAKLENAVSASAKNSILDSIITKNKTELSTLEQGLKLYNSYAKDLLKKVPKAYRDAAKNGKIALVSDFFRRLNRRLTVCRARGERLCKRFVTSTDPPLDALTE